LVGGNLSFIAASLGHEVLGTTCKHPVEVPGCQTITLDLRSPIPALRSLQHQRFDCIIHTAAITNPDYCELHKTEAWRVNVEGTRHLANWCQQMGYYLIYFSTDLVFDGEKGLYSEEDPPNPLSYYATTKLEGERVVSESRVEYCIVRSAVVYGWNITKKMSFSEWILDCGRRGKEATLFLDQYRSPILVNNLAHVILDIAGKRLKGLLHVGGPERIDRFTFGLKLVETFKMNKRFIKGVRMKDFPFQARRPMDCSFDIGRLRRVCNIELLDVREGLKRFKELEEEGYVERLTGVLRG
jgi:dTDP-4-dehydrorhamnose reductase